MGFLCLNFFWLTSRSRLDTFLCIIKLSKKGWFYASKYIIKKNPT